MPPRPASESTPRQRDEGAFLSAGFRPFFLAAGIWAALAMALWSAVLATGTALPSRLDPLDWHIHEMLFGFVMAAIGGFLLTAVANWTGRPPVRGSTLAGLLALWLLGRVACFVSALLPLWLVIAAALSFPVALAIVAGREMAAGRNWRNMRLLVPVAVLGAANLLMDLESAGVAIPHGLGARLGVAATLILISVIGGRIVPSFTRNWLVRRRSARLPTQPRALDRAALGVLHAGLIGWVAYPQSGLVGALLLAGALLNAWRLLNWQGMSTLREPLLFILHLGYAWLVLGTALLGLAALGLEVPASAAIHALTAGAIGTMVLAVMTRASRGHTGRALCADPITNLVYACITLGAIARVAAAFFGAHAMPLLMASAGLWIAAFGLFALSYAPMLLLPRNAH
jgi:uncharacterized protein involved in response to NO